MSSLFNSKPLIYFLFGACGIVYLLGLIGIDLIEVDSAQYGCLSFEMIHANSFLQVFERGHDYLDKPPLLFWLGALSYSIFGISDFAFRLPSFLFTILGTYSTFRLTKSLYNHNTGIAAALILFSSQAFFLFNHDVRTDCLLTNSVIFAVWQLWTHIETNKIKNFILGFIGVALAMLSKGPIGIIVPAFAIGTQLILSGNFKKIFHWKWIAGILLILIILSPMVYGLYQQFGIRGVRFYFWTQSFGRITGESSWKDDSSVFFFTHTFLWSFLPWTIFAIAAFFEKFITLIKSKFKAGNIEYISFGGFILTFVALSLSRYKLPHYIFVTYPFAAIFTAHYLTKFTSENERVNLFLKYLLLGFQYLIILVFIVFPALVMAWIFPTSNFLLWGIYILFVTVVMYLLFKKQIKESLILISVMLAINLNVILNAHFYPTLLKYQSGSMAAHYLNEEYADPKDVYYLNEYSFPFEFYLQYRVPFYYQWETLVKSVPENKKEIWVFTNEEGYQSIKEKNATIISEKLIKHMQVAMLNGKFLNPATREGALRNTYVLKIKI